MTTIATDGFYIAADSQATQGGTIVAVRVQKIFKGPKGYFGCSGPSHCIVGYKDWLNGKGPRLDRDDNFRALHLDYTGEIYLIEGNYDAHVLQENVGAIGTGADFARAVMAHGGSPYEAVKIACKLDESSGGTVRVKHI